jgi:hypothetical protein
MLKENANAYVELGRDLLDARVIYALDDNLEDDPNRFGNKRLTKKAAAELRAELAKLQRLAERLKLPVTRKQIGRRMVYDHLLPQSEEAFDALIETFSDELSEKLFLSVSTADAAYYERDNLLGEAARTAFPMATAEMRMSGNSLACDLPTAAVFHCMRAIEHGLRALAADVGLTFDVQQWREIIGQIESRLTDIQQHGIPGMDKATKDERLQFLSEAAKEFSYFKDSWRNYVMHAKATYGPQQARTVLNHTRDFLNRISDRLKE